jgi:hypothetical protein
MVLRCDWSSREAIELELPKYFGAFYNWTLTDAFFPLTLIE